MNIFKTIWGLLFRLFPCPTEIGLRRIGNPGPDSPVLVTCNFHLTVKRLMKLLRGMDLWLLVAESKGVNVWCAAGGDEFNTHSVVSAIKTSGIADQVNHRTVILPQYGAPGIKASEVSEQTGWKIKWGPAYGKDIPRYIANHYKKDDQMIRAKYGLMERLDTALGSLFPFCLVGALLVYIFGRSIFADFLITGSVAFLFFFSFCPWIPGKRGIVKALFCDIVLLAVFFAIKFMNGFSNPFSTQMIIAMILLPLYGLELGGLASTLPSDLDPFLAKLGVGAIGNVSFAGTIRTELLNKYRKLSYNKPVCIGCRTCTTVCPQGVWEMGADKRAVQANINACTACRACLVQCPSGAIHTELTTKMR